MKLKKHLREYEKQLNSWVNAIWREMVRRKLTNREMAKRSRVCEHTVSRLNRYVTRLPRLSTVYQMAKAVDLSFVLEGVESRRRQSA